MSYFDVPQRSEEWWKIRSGKATASMQWAVEKFCKPTKAEKDLGKNGRESSDRAHYRSRLIAQTLTGYLSQHKRDDERWKGWDVAWGEEFEDIARAEYMARNGCEVEKVGIYVHDEISRFAASPDGSVGLDGLIQIKCPATTTHLEYWDGEVVPEEYEPQLVAEMAVTGRKWSDFVSFDPRLPKDLQLFVVRLNRNEERIRQCELAVLTLLEEVDSKIAKLLGGRVVEDLTPILEESLRQVRV